MLGFLGLSLTQFIDSQPGVGFAALTKKPDGKKIIIDIEAYFPICDDATGLPFVEIFHTVPNEEIYHTEINNINAEIVTLDNEIDQLFELIESFKNKIASYQEEAEMLKADLDFYNKMIATNIGNLRNHKEEFLKKKISLSNENIERHKKDIEKLLEMQRQDESMQEEYLIKYERSKYTYRRMAFLIKDQLSKDIPQSLVEFIEMAFDMNEGKEIKEKSLREEKNNQERHFINFVNLYNKHKESLLYRVNSVLEDPSYRCLMKHFEEKLLPFFDHDKEGIVVEDIVISEVPSEIKSQESKKEKRKYYHPKRNRCCCSLI